MTFEFSTRRAFLETSIGTAAVVLAAPMCAWAGQLSDVDTARFLNAVRNGDLKAVQAMLDAAPALIGAVDAEKRTAFALAILHKHPPIAAIMRERGYEPDLHEAALALDWDLFNEFAATGEASVNAPHPLGGTAMYCAALGGAGSDIWRVYSKCGDPNVQPAGGHGSPVRIALEFHDLTTAELTAATLLGNGADPNPAESDRKSPLHISASRGSTEIVEILIRKGADIDARDTDNARPIDLADRNSHKAVVEMLRQHDRIPRDCASSRRTFDAHGKAYTPPAFQDIPLPDRSNVVGNSHGDIDAVRNALKQDVRLAHAVATTTEGAVEAGAHMGRMDIVDLLLEHGAPYSLPTAVMRNDIPRVKALLKQDPKRITERGAHDFALLWYPVIGGGSIEMMELLLNAGAQIEFQHHLGTTALHFAIMRRQTDMVRFLIERGANVNRPGRKFGGARLTPLEMARDGGDEKIIRVLEEHGARG